jgi:membrane protease YdiL (CAAX protease family)
VKPVFELRWKPNKDLLVVLVSWFLVLGALYTATTIVGPTTGGGLPYFFLYAVLTATIFGIGIPVFWLVFVQKRPIKDLGITFNHLFLSLGLQAVFAIIVLPGGFSGLFPLSLETILPLLGLSLSIGFFEAVFWRGWVLMRLEEAFGFLPAAIIGSVLYAVYHIGYDMPLSEITFLFFIGLMYAVVFRITRSIFILWPIFQPGGQLITLINEGLNLPLISTLGFVEILFVMILIVWLGNRYYKRQK